MMTGLLQTSDACAQSLDNGIIKLDIMCQDTGGNIGYSRDQYTI